MRRFSKESLEALRHVHPALVAVAFLGLQNSQVDFRVIEGRRSPERQRALHAEGRSRTMMSKHLEQPDGWAHAIDVMAVGVASAWAKEHYREIARAMNDAALELGVSIRWGGGFNAFYDGPHFELVDR